MPYANILWIKLEKRLLNDHRFFTMSERAQLYFIKVLLLCAQSNNKVPRKYDVLKQLLRTECNESELENILTEIRNNFPKFLAHKDYYYIKGFKEKHNYVAPKEFPNNSEGNPKEHVDKIRIEQIRKEYCDRKGFAPEDLSRRDLNRIYVGITELLKQAKGDVKKATAAILWVTRQDWVAKKNFDWDIFTVVKKFPEFSKQYRDFEKVADVVEEIKQL